MPARSDAQRRLMAIAEHEPGKLYSRNKGVANMSHEQLRDFASTSEKNLPEHVKPAIYKRKHQPNERA